MEPGSRFAGGRGKFHPESFGFQGCKKGKDPGHCIGLSGAGATRNNGKLLKQGNGCCQPLPVDNISPWEYPVKELSGPYAIERQYLLTPPAQVFSDSLLTVVIAGKPAAMASKTTREHAS